jgi:uncharacterized integral membrane protein
MIPKERAYFNIAILSLSIGLVIYVIFRPSSILLFRLFDFCGIEPFIDFVRARCIGASRFLPIWVIYSLPEGLWLYSYLLCIRAIWLNFFNPIIYGWLLIMPLIAILLEFCQRKFIPGTFDYNDILIILISSIAGFTIPTNGKACRVYEQRRITRK